MATGELKVALLEYNRNFQRNEAMKRMILAELSEKRKSLHKIVQSGGNYYDPRARTPAIPEFKLEAKAVVRQSFAEQKHASKHIRRLKMCEKELLAAEKNTALLQQVSDSRNRVQELLSSLENTDGTGVPANNDGAMEWLAEFSVDAEMRARRKLEKEIEERSIEKEKIVKVLTETAETANAMGKSAIKPSMPTVNLEKAVEEAANNAQIWKKEMVPFSRKMLQFARKTHEEGQAVLMKLETKLLETEDLLECEKQGSQTLKNKITSSEREIEALKLNRDKQVTKINSLQEQVRTAAAKLESEVEALKDENFKMQKELREVQYVIVNAEKNLLAEKERSAGLSATVAEVTGKLHEARQASALDRRRIKEQQREIQRCTKALQEFEENNAKELERLKDTIKITKHECNELKENIKTMTTNMEMLQEEKDTLQKEMEDEVRKAKREEERLEEELETVTRERGALVEKCETLENDLLAANAKVSTLESDHAENSANQADLKENLSRAMKEAASLRRKVNDFSTQLKLADEKISNLSVPPVKHSDKAIQAVEKTTSEKSIKKTLETMKKQHLLERQHFREELESLQTMNSAQAMRIIQLEAMKQTVKSERELYETLQDVDESAIEKPSTSNDEGVSEWDDDKVVKVPLPAKPKKVKRVLMESFSTVVVAKVSAAVQTEPVHSRHTTPNAPNNGPLESVAPPVTRIDEESNEEGPVSHSLPKSEGMTMREWMAESKVGMSQNTLNKQAMVLENVFKRKQNSTKVQGILSRILFNQQRRILWTKVAWARWTRNLGGVRTEPAAVTCTVAQSTPIQRKRLPGSGYGYDPRTGIVTALPAPNIIDSKEKLETISNACLNMRFKACAQEKSTLLSIASLLNEVASCVTEERNAVKSQSLESLCIEWLTYIENRIPLLQQEERKVKSQQAHDIIHFIAKDSYRTVSPQSLPRHTLDGYKSYLARRLPSDKHDMPSRSSPQGDPYESPMVKPAPKRQYNKKRHVACRLKAISPIKVGKDGTRHVYYKKEGQRHTSLSKRRKKKQLLRIEGPDRDRCSPGSSKPYSASSTKNPKEEDGVLLSLDEVFTLPETASPPMISLDEAFEPPPPPRHKSYHQAHIESMKSRSNAARNVSSTLKLRKFSRAKSNASQVNPWTPLESPDTPTVEDDLSAMLQISSGGKF